MNEGKAQGGGRVQGKVGEQRTGRYKAGGGKWKTHEGMSQKLEVQYLQGQWP